MSNIYEIIKTCKSNKQKTETLGINENLNSTFNEIWLLKGLLKQTDYKAIKYAEGEMSEEEYAPIRAMRIEWRVRINMLENQEEDK